jgi:hypothetical protein
VRDHPFRVPINIDPEDTMVSLTAAYRVGAATAPMLCIRTPTLVGSLSPTNIRAKECA